MFTSRLSISADSFQCNSSIHMILARDKRSNTFSKMFGEINSRVNKMSKHWSAGGNDTETVWLIEGKQIMSKCRELIEET